MELQKLIHKRLFKSSFSIFDTQGKKVDPQIFRQEYLILRSYLSHHLKPQDVLAIKLKKDVSYLMTLLACMDLGITYIPMKETYPMDRVEQIQRSSHFKLLIDEELFKSILSNNSSFNTPFEEINKTGDFPLSPSQPLYIIFTSGSTGMPKGVVISRQAAANYCQWMSQYFNHFSSEDHILQVTDFTFDISLNDIFAFLNSNTHIYFSSFTGNIFVLAHEIENYKISIINSVPNNFNMLFDKIVMGKANYSSLKTLLIGGARFSLGLYQKIKDTFSSLKTYNLYGPTECTIYTHIKAMNFSETDLHDSTVSVGQPLTNVKCLIFNGSQELPSGEKGELLLGGVQLMNEYINDPKKTHSALIEFNGEIYYKTGDLAFKNDANDYFITGRLDDTIKHRGFRINLSDIDSYILKLSYVKDCATIAIPDELQENKIIAFLIIEANKSTTDIKSDLGSILLDYQIPDKINIVDNLPVNSNGKVCKKSLKERFLGRS